MSKIYTADDLLRYIYNETDKQETLEISALLEADAKLRKEFTELSESIGMLEEAELNAHPTSISLVLEHSQKMHELHH